MANDTRCVFCGKSINPFLAHLIEKDTGRT